MARDKDEDPKYRKSFDGEPMIPMTGRVARMHNITYIPLTDEEQDEHMFRIENTSHSVYRLYRDEPLFTYQEHFGTQGIRHYIDRPNDYGEGIDKPQIYPDEDGDLWINDGHHRIIASRLRGEPYIDVYKHDSYEDGF